MSYNNYSNRLSSERYLVNKEYFNKSLIELLERQSAQISKFKESEEIYKATIYKLRAKVKTLSIRLKSQDNVNRLLDNAYSQIEKLLAENDKLREENKLMKEELSFFKLNHKKDNTNSSIPSSYVVFKANANSRNKSIRNVGGQTGHELHKSKLLKPDKIIIKYCRQAPTGAVLNYDENGNEYYATQEIDLILKAKVIEIRYYLNGNNSLSDNILTKYKINPLTYSDNLKSQVLYLYSKGIIPFQRLSDMLKVLSKNILDIKPSTIVSWIHEHALNHKDEETVKLKRLLNSNILHIDETGFRVNGNNKWIHILTDGKDKYYKMTDKRSEFLNVMHIY